MKKLILIPFLALAFLLAICTKGTHGSTSDELRKKELDLKKGERAYWKAKRA